MRKAATFIGLALGLYLIVRAVAEPFVIDMSNPATYRNDWGGPSLFGVLLVHCGPGVAAAVAIAMFLIRRRSSGRPTRAAWPAVGPQRGTRAGGRVGGARPVKCHLTVRFPPAR
jgi:hypothetical protein